MTRVNCAESVDVYLMVYIDSNRESVGNQCDDYNALRITTGMTMCVLYSLRCCVMFGAHDVIQHG